MFGDQYDFVQQFDHSTGHTKKRLHGLDAKNMNYSWGGTKNTVMRDTMIEQSAGFLGPHYDPTNLDMVKVGEMQSMMYKTSDTGPFHL